MEKALSRRHTGRSENNLFSRNAETLGDRAMKRPPLIITGLPRSGTSFIAGVFVNHGFWYGNSCALPSEKKFKSRGGYYENKYVQKFMMAWCLGHPKDGFVNEYLDGMKEMFEWIVLDDGYKDNGSPWLVKFGACHAPPWFESYPDATVVIVRRPVKVIKKSYPTIGDARIKSHLPIMNGAEEKENGFRIDYNKVVDGDYSQFEKPLQREGIEFKKEMVDQLLRKDLRHYK
jgi:hypothetical protein